MFFVYETQLPHSIGFSLYGISHLCTLAGISFSCLIGARWYKRQPDSTRHSFSHALGLTIFLLDMLRYVVYWRIGGLSIYELPLHLCGLAVYLCILHSIWKPDWLSQVLYTLCLPGACCALLFPDWTHYPFWSFVSLHSFWRTDSLSFIWCFKPLPVRSSRGYPPFGNRFCSYVLSSRRSIGLIHNGTPIICFCNCPLQIRRSSCLPTGRTAVTRSISCYLPVSSFSSCLA